MEAQTKVNKFISLKLDTLNGEILLLVFKNERKSKEGQPDYNVCVSRANGLKQVGVGWIQETKKEVPKADSTEDLI